MTVSGSLADVNATLATLSDTDPTSLPDTITYGVTDSLGVGGSNQTTAVVCAPTLSGVPAAKTVGEIGVTAIGGPTVAEVGAPASEPFQVAVSDTKGILGASNTGGATVSGSAEDLLVTGTLAQVNAALASLHDTETSTAPDTVHVQVTDQTTSAVSATASIAATVGDTPAAIEGLTTAQIATLTSNGVTTLDTGAAVQLAVATAETIGQAGIAVESGFTFVDDSAANIQALTAADIGYLGTAGVQQIEAMGGVTLSFAQVGALEAASIPVVANGGAVTLSGTAVQIEALLPADVTKLSTEGVTALSAIDGSVVLSASLGQALEGEAFVSGPIPVSAPGGDTVRVADTAANIEALAATVPLGQLSQAGVSQVTSMDASLVLTVAEAESVAGNVTVSVPAGDTVTIVDTAATIEGITNPGQLNLALHYTAATANSAWEVRLLTHPDLRSVHPRPVIERKVSTWLVKRTLISHQRG